MKSHQNNIISFIVVLLLCMVLSSCDTLYLVPSTEQPTEHQEFSYREKNDPWLPIQSATAKASKLSGIGDYLYFKDAKSFVKYNVTTGTKTYICNDPVCSHITKECPLYGYTDFGAVPLFYNDNFFYFVNYSEGIYVNGIFDHIEYVRNFSYYNILDQKHHIILEDFSVNFVEYIIAENYFYYYHPYQDNEGNYIYYLNSINLSNSVITEKLLLADLEGRQPNNILLASNGQLYFASYMYGELYSYNISDFSTKTLLYKAPDGYNIAHIGGQDESLYFVIQNSDCSDQKLCYLNLNTSETTILYSFPSPLSYVYYTQSYAYFTYNEKKTIGTTNDTQETIKLPASKIYRVSLSEPDSSEEFVFEFTDNMSNFSINSFVVSGNYIYAYYISWIPSGVELTSSDGYNSIDDRIIMRIDVETGEIYYIK